MPIVEADFPLPIVGAHFHEETGPCMCGGNRELNCLSAECANDDCIGDARPASRIPPKGKSKGKTSAAAISKFSESSCRQALTAIAAVYDTQAAAASTAAATKAATAAAIIYDLNARLSKFDWSLGPNSWYGNSVERQPRESRPQVHNEHLMQSEPNDSIFPSAPVQQLVCTLAQDIFAAAGDAESTPEDASSVATPLTT